MTIDQKKENLVNIWETHSCFLCPVAGLCLSDFEIRKILKTPGNSKVTPTDSYGLHQAVMDKLKEKNNSSEKADRILRARYAKALDRFGTVDEAEFQKAWNNSLLESDMPAMWTSFQERSIVDEKNKKLRRCLSELKRSNADLANENLRLKGLSSSSKRILIVGGLTKLKAMYRKIVESNGGIFDYHSGRIRSGKNNLEARVKRSDLVICPVNHNSHTACLKVKQFCNKHSKDMHMIPGSSLTAISTVFAASGLESSHGSCSIN